MLFIIAPRKRPPTDVYYRAHYECILEQVVASGVSFSADAGMNDVLPEACGMLVLGDTTEELWRSLDTPCLYCGQGDTDEAGGSDDSVDKSWDASEAGDAS